MDSRKRRIVSDNEDKPADLYKEWDETSCPICMEHPHNAILLVCSSHEKGCRSYICDTSYRHSNCLDRFKKLKEKNPNTTSSPPHLNPGSFPVSVDTFPVSVDFPSEEINNNNNNIEKLEDRPNLKCPLCRGTVSGLRVIEEARKYLNSKLRSCSRESCVFSGNYRELREHARRVHPTVRPADIDPSRERAWRRLEDQREYNDTVSAVPGSVVVGDYAIESGGNGATRGSTFGDDWMSRVLLYHMMHSMNDLEPDILARPRLRGYAMVRPRFVESGSGSGSGGRTIRRRRYLWGENLLGLQNDRDDDEDDDDDDEDDEDEDEDEDEEDEDEDEEGEEDEDNEDDEDDEDDDDDNEEEDDEVDMNMLSDIGPPRRRLRRRITQARSENEDRQ